MALLDDITLGRHVPGDSLLHRVDPRLKLAGVPLLIVAVFSAHGFLRLGILGLMALLCVPLSGIESRLWWRGIWVFRHFSSLLTLTTSPHELAAAFASFLGPLRRFRFPAEDATMLFLLVLHFIPILREEAAESIARCREAGEDPARGPLLERARTLRRMTAPLILRLVDRAETLARGVAAGEDVVGLRVVLQPFRRIDRTDCTVFLAGALALILVFRLP
jgi:energy-coupling factor transport system permease protein